MLDLFHIKFHTKATRQSKHNTLVHFLLFFYNCNIWIPLDFVGTHRLRHLKFLYSSIYQYIHYYCFHETDTTSFFNFALFFPDSFYTGYYFSTSSAKEKLKLRVFYSFFCFLIMQLSSHTTSYSSPAPKNIERRQATGKKVTWSPHQLLLVHRTK